MVERQIHSENLSEQIKTFRTRIANKYNSRDMKELLHERWLNGGGDLSNFELEIPKSPYTFQIRSPRKGGVKYWITRETRIDGSPFNIFLEEIRSDGEGHLQVEARFLSSGSKQTVIYTEQEAVDKANEILDTLILPGNPDENQDTDGVQHGRTFE